MFKNLKYKVPIFAKRKDVREQLYPQEFFPDDIFLVSYPKSGNTWLRFLIGNAISDNNCDFSNIHQLVPDIFRNRDVCSTLARPRFMKSHLYFVPDFGRVVYLVRDGRDVAVSFYYHSLKKGNIPLTTSFAEFLKMFNKGKVKPRVRTWSNHVNSWLDSKTDNILLLKYEDMKRDTFGELKRVFEYFDIPMAREQLISAVAASEFSRMQSLEKEQNDKYHDFVNTDPSIPFMRKGKVGDWKEYFTKEQLKDFIDIHGAALRRLGYLL